MDMNKQNLWAKIQEWVMADTIATMAQDGLEARFQRKHNQRTNRPKGGDYFPKIVVKTPTGYKVFHLGAKDHSLIQAVKGPFEKCPEGEEYIYLQITRSPI